MTTKKILITGGAGFIGVNAARYFSKKGWDVHIFDNMSRRGTYANLEALHREIQINFSKGDVRNVSQVEELFRKNRFDAILHLAAQVAVTTSVVDPRDDFEVNALGTFNILEAVRQYSPDTTLIYASTNKVYGKMTSVEIGEKNGRYEYLHEKTGIDEQFPLDFYSPYGCSKGTGDQYVLDYARIYNLPTVSFRQSCIYGSHQFGVEDQGWVAWFIIAVMLNRPITIFGDGRQIRDILHVADLVRAYEAAIENINTVQGNAFNVGGGIENTLSLLELIEMLEDFTGQKIRLKFGDWRPGDQKVFVSDIRKAKKHLQWQPEFNVKRGVFDLYQWVETNRALIEKALNANG